MSTWGEKHTQTVHGRDVSPLFRQARHRTVETTEGGIGGNLEKVREEDGYPGGDDEGRSQGGDRRGIEQEEPRYGRPRSIQWTSRRVGGTRWSRRNRGTRRSQRSGVPRQLMVNDRPRRSQRDQGARWDKWTDEPWWRGGS